VDADGYNEGAGDMLPLQGRLFGGYGFRTDIDAHRAVERAIGVTVESFELVDPRYYHIDTCFCPLPDDKLIWYPTAFSAESASRIKELVPEANRYEVSASDGELFACNAVAVPGSVVLNRCGPELASWLQGLGLRVHQTPLNEFMKAGGSAKCLTLRLDTAE